MNASVLGTNFAGNPMICDCRDYDIISYIRLSAPFRNWLSDVNCAAPSELANAEVSYVLMRASSVDFYCTLSLCVHIKKASRF